MPHVTTKISPILFFNCDNPVDLLNRWSNDRQALTPVDPTYFSSYLFLTNTLLTYYCNYYTYSVLFTFLFITSILYHTYYSDIFFYVDKLAIMLVILYGGHLLYMKYKYMSFVRIISIFTTFVTVGFIFYYGYFTKQYCYDPVPITGLYYHSILHLVSSIGHHLITI
jgi:hypothetical protein